MAEFVPSKYQIAGYEWLQANLGTGNHAVFQAVAGSGKTTFGISLFDKLPKNISSEFVAFNASIAAELKSRLPQGASARTYHSLGLQSIRKTYRTVQVDGDKTEKILKAYLGPNEKFLIGSIRRLVGLCKNFLIVKPKYAHLDGLAAEHDIDLYDEYSSDNKERIFYLVEVVLSKSLDMTGVVDFDDMVSMPMLDDKINISQYDFLFVDEVQDTNLAQLYLAMNSIKDTGTIIGVGDSNQSCYAFRGADSEAMARLTEELDATQLPLSICYRCPTSVRDLVNKENPDIVFETPEWAIEGKIENIGLSKVESTVQVNDMVICRINADLVPVAFNLIRKGIKATIRGRDIGKSLITLIRKQHADSVPDLLTRMNEFRDKQYERFIAMDKPHKIVQLDDQIATIEAIQEGANSVTEIIERCETIFSDEKSAVTLSSIHRAKGLEAKNVFILRPDLLPHPKAKKPEQLIQEKNLRYIAVTRAQENLYFVAGQNAG